MPGDNRYQVREVGSNRRCCGDRTEGDDGSDHGGIDGDREQCDQVGCIDGQVMILRDFAEEPAEGKDAVSSDGVRDPLRTQDTDRCGQKAVKPGEDQNGDCAACTDELDEVLTTKVCQYRCFNGGTAMVKYSRPIVRVGSVDDAAEILHTE